MCGLMAISHRLPSSSSAAAILVRHCPCCPLPSSASMSKIHTSAFYPLHPQVSSAKFICNLPVLTSSHPHTRTSAFYHWPSITQFLCANHSCGIRTFCSPVFSLLGVKVPSGNLRSQEKSSRELSPPYTRNFRSW